MKTPNQFDLRARQHWVIRKHHCFPEVSVYFLWMLVLPVWSSGPVCPLAPGCGPLPYSRTVLECPLLRTSGWSTLSGDPLDLKNQQGTFFILIASDEIGQKA